jgi:hypothetical protein
MRLLRRFCEVMVLLLSAVGIIGCASGIICVWIFYPSICDKAQTISSRLDVGLQRVSAANQNVRRAIERARADVATASKESADVGGGGEKGSRASRAAYGYPAEGRTKHGRSERPADHVIGRGRRNLQLAREFSGAADGAEGSH